METISSQEELREVAQVLTPAAAAVAVALTPFLQPGKQVLAVARPRGVGALLARTALVVTSERLLMRRPRLLRRAALRGLPWSEVEAIALNTGSW